MKLLPCQFSSGLEERVAQDEGFDLGGAEDVDIILQLGGDAFWGWREKRKRKVPLLRYGFGTGGFFNFAYDSYLLPHPSLKKIFDGRKAVVVGSLSSDRVNTLPSRKEAREILGLKDEFLLGIFPGSRLPIWKRASLFLKELIKTLPKDVVVRVGRSPFIPREEPSFLPEASPELLLVASDLLLTLPGTNTLEAAACGTPMLVVAPLSFLDLAPMAGFWGSLSSLPIFGKSLRLFILRSFLKRVGFISWPNRLIGEELVPEMVGEVSPRDVARRISSLIEDGGEILRSMRERLPKIVGGPGASWRIEEVLRESLSC